MANLRTSLACPKLSDAFLLDDTVLSLMTLYHTHTSVRNTRSFSGETGLKGVGWKLVLLDNSPSTGSMPGMSRVGIVAKSRYLADKAYRLIQASSVLLHGEDLLGEYYHVYATSEPETDGIKSYWYPNNETACYIAVRISRSQRLVYALARYVQSIRSCNINQDLLYPDIHKYIPLSRYPDEHISFANSIELAYSAIEELGFHPIRSPERNRIIENNKWLPNARLSYEQELKAQGINTNEKFVWHMRGPSTAISKKMFEHDCEYANWNKYPVRDRLINLVDAIALAHRLRSRFAAHETKKETSSLSIYDVANVQHLARRLIIESVGFWKIDSSDAT